jgi:hypothetical protein
MITLLLLSCTGPPSDTGVGPPECGPQSVLEEGCPIDSCAAGCSSVEAGISCCIDTHGRGNFDANNLERLTNGCSGSNCEPEEYVSPRAALCISQVHGLESGVRWCGSTFEFSGDERTWTNRNTVSYECGDGREYGDTLYDVIQIDARTGAYMGTWEDIALVACSE